MLELEAQLVLLKNFPSSNNTMNTLAEKLFFQSLPSPPVGCYAIAATALTACASDVGPVSVFAENQPIGVDAESGAILLALADLAREGSPAICAKAYLEKKLNIKITDEGDGVIDHFKPFSAKVAPVSSAVKISDGHYGRYSNGKTETCYLSIVFEKVFLCDAQSPRNKAIPGKKIEYSAPDPHRTALGMFYSFKPISGGMSYIKLGTTGVDCIHGFSISAAKAN